MKNKENNIKKLINYLWLAVTIASILFLLVTDAKLLLFPIAFFAGFGIMELLYRFVIKKRIKKEQSKE